MFSFDSRTFILAAGALALGSAYGQADLVYQDQRPVVTSPAPSQPPSQTQRLQRRETVRQDYAEQPGTYSSQVPGSSQQLASPYTSQASRVQSQPIRQAPQIVYAPPAQPVQKVQADLNVDQLTQSELIRRKRIRQELQNEDLLQTRMEELRLRDEKRRTDNLVQGAPVESLSQNDPAVVGAAPVEAQPGMMEQQVVLPPATAGQLNQDQIELQQAQAVYSEKNSSSYDDVQISFSPRVGMSNINTNAGFDVRTRFSVGGGLGIELNDNLGFEVGYNYNEYGVNYGNGTPFGGNYGFYNSYYAGYGAYNGTNEPIVIRQNVIDTGLRYHLLGRHSRFRPYIGAGAGYAWGFVNYNRDIINYWRSIGVNYGGRDFNMQQYLGTLSAGFNVGITKAVGVGLGMKYYQVLHSRQTGPNNGFYNPSFGYYGGYNPYGFFQDEDKRQVANSVADSGFYSIMGGVTLTF